MEFPSIHGNEWVEEKQSLGKKKKRKEMKVKKKELEEGERR